MRKTTEELVNECVSELKDSQFDFNDLDAVDKQMLFQWFETFRRLVIENARECTEAVGVTASLPGTNNGYTFVAFNGSDVPYGTKLFTFPPAAIDRDSVIEACAKVVEQIQDDDPSDGINGWTAARCIRRLKSQPAAPDPRDEVIRLAKTKLQHVDYVLMTLNKRSGTHVCSAELKDIEESVSHALAAIDALPRRR